ncbi:acyloxyacyl hydrolase [Paraflavitalea speifideaquila]|uniref:acyloxyacyl hydrolase n=1 Tax=Paraflavitalea speifideaquila TaxID=3076558 RepID=UPI0028E2E839|nr:acyloxyacyl hydrolase [Paraflavitalea speifideiaquila]
MAIPGKAGLAKGTPLPFLWHWFYSGNVGDIEIFGRPHAAFGFITFPFSNKRRNNFQIEPALGLTYNLKPYNPEHNVINDAIGAKFAVYFALNLGGKYKINREIDLLYGYDITHFSNGRTVTPNLGLNMMGFSVGGRYNFNAAQRKTDNSIFPTTLLDARPHLQPAQPHQRSELIISPSTRPWALYRTKTMQAPAIVTLFPQRYWNTNISSIQNMQPA